MHGGGIQVGCEPDGTLVGDAGTFVAIRKAYGTFVPFVPAKGPGQRLADCGTAASERRPVGSCRSASSQRGHSAGAKATVQTRVVVPASVTSHHLTPLSKR